MDDEREAIDAETAAARYDVPVALVRRWASERKRRKDGTLNDPKLTAVAKVSGRGRGGKVSLFRPEEVERVVNEWRKMRHRRRVDSPNR